MKNFLTLLVISTGLVFTSCNEDDPLETGSMSIEFNSVLENATLDLNSTIYPHAPGGSFVVEDFKYYISNIALLNEDRDVIFQDIEGYYLIHKDQNYEDYVINIEGIPTGKVYYMQFMLGVDPESNLSIDNVGDLDPNNQMAWNWNIGYKFLLFEGMFTDEMAQEKPLVFHIGGDSNGRFFQYEFQDGISIRKSKALDLKITADVSRSLKIPTPLILIPPVLLNIPRKLLKFLKIMD